jgi:arylsulfatase A-like enzyme
MNKEKNIIYILQDHQSYYNHGNYKGGVKPKRPCFEEFAANGVCFENARCVTPMCGPARRSMLTGLYPHTHGQVHNENDPPYKDSVFLDILKSKGYSNYYFGKWHAGPGNAKDHGCEGFSYTSYGNPYITKEYKEYLNRKNLPPAEHYIEKSFMADSYIEQNYFPKLQEGKLYKCETAWCGEHASGITVTPKETHESFFLADLACEKLEEIAKNKRDKPFSMSIHFWGPHQPFFPTKEFADLYNPEDISEYPSFKDNFINQPDVFRMEASRPLTSDGKWIDVPNPLPWSEWQKIIARCYGHISMIDAAGGQIIDKLKELGLDDDTLIVWATDHGDALASHGGHFDKDSHMSEEVMRIPLALNLKNIVPKGIKDNHHVFSCDIPVTLLDAANVSFPNRVDGRSLLDITIPSRKKSDWRKSIMCESYGHGYGTTIISRMVIKNDYKYVITENDIEQLYNLKEDPYEMNNLAELKEYLDKKEELIECLKRQQKLSKDPIVFEKMQKKIKRII